MCWSTGIVEKTTQHSSTPLLQLVQLVQKEQTMKSSKYIMVSLGATVCMVLVSGCASKPALRRVGLEEWIRTQSRSALLGDKPSEFTMRYLLRRDLVTAFERQPEKLLVEMDKELCPRTDRDTLFTLSELCYLRAKRVKHNREQELKLYLSSACYAYACLFDQGSGAHINEFDPRFRMACDFYNRSLAALFGGSKAGVEMLAEGKTTLPLIQGEINVNAPRESIIQLDRLTRDSLAYSYDATSFATQSRRFGLGVPVIAERTAGGSRREGKGDMQRRLPQVTAATILLRFNNRICEAGAIGRSLQADFEVFDPIATPEIEVAGRRVPLEADLTTPLAFLLEANRDLSGVAGMRKKLKGDLISARRGLYMLQPYQPGKIPVLFVHGLMSDPTVWIRMLNDLIFDPVLSERYQFWTFFYPTSTPIIISAAELRESLLWTRTELDPDDQDPALDQMVIIGHSMGGLLTRLMIQRNDSSLFKSSLGVSIDELDVSEEERGALRRMESFEPLPFVDRVLFLATPHRGAKMAQTLVGRIGDMMSDAPRYVLETVEGTLETIGLDPKDLPSGIDNLRMDSQFMAYYNSLPRNPDVPFHSIIGNKKMADTPGGTDGVVAYESSHLDDAASEKIVKSGHSVMNHPQTVLEVRRILSLHLNGLR
jgi:pimeloyl-ACP methyl ester carboxylesterase